MVMFESAKKAMLLTICIPSSIIKYDMHAK